MLSGCIWSWLAAIAVTLPTPVFAISAEDHPGYPRHKPSPADLDIASRTVWGESRSESWRGKLAVAYVVCNRASIAKAHIERTGQRHRMFGDGTLAGACLAPWQFSVWSKSDPNHRRLAGAARQPGWEECVDAVMTAVSRREKDPSGSATHYCTKGSRPAWARGEPAVTIGAHKFYNLAD